MTAELKHSAATGADASVWKPYPAYKDSGVGWPGKVPEQENNEKVIFQTGLTGSTGYVLSFVPVHPVILSRFTKPQMNADERRLITQSHRKGRKERKAKPQKSLSIYKTIRTGTRMTLIKWISTDNPIRVYPRHPRNPRSIVFEPYKKIRNQRHFSSITEQEAAQ